MPLSLQACNGTALPFFIPKYIETLVLGLTWLQLQRQGHVLSLAVGEDILITSGKIGQQFESPTGSPDREIIPLIVF